MMTQFIGRNGQTLLPKKILVGLASHALFIMTGTMHILSYIGYAWICFKWRFAWTCCIRIIRENGEYPKLGYPIDIWPILSATHSRYSPARAGGFRRTFTEVLPQVPRKWQGEPDTGWGVTGSSLVGELGDFSGDFKFLARQKSANMVDSCRLSETCTALPHQNYKVNIFSWVLLAIMCERNTETDKPQQIIVINLIWDPIELQTRKSYHHIRTFWRVEAPEKIEQ